MSGHQDHLHGGGSQGVGYTLSSTLMQNKLRNTPTEGQRAKRRQCHKACIHADIVHDPSQCNATTFPEQSRKISNKLRNRERRAF